MLTDHFKLKQQTLDKLKQEVIYMRYKFNFRDMFHNLKLIGKSENK